jgi:hypothetical protein
MVFCTTNGAILASDRDRGDKEKTTMTQKQKSGARSFSVHIKLSSRPKSTRHYHVGITETTSSGNEKEAIIIFLCTRKPRSMQRLTKLLTQRTKTTKK